MSAHGLTPGDPWPEHYRGLTLHMSADNEIFWRQYNGEQRLFLEDAPDHLVRSLDDLKPAGARFRVTEKNDVIAKVEEDDEYTPIYVGALNRPERLIPRDEPEYGLELAPEGLTEGDLWPSVYDGARYSLMDSDRIWWDNPETKRRHPVVDGIPDRIAQRITKHKTTGGSFRITPWGDVITLIDAVPEPKGLIDQFDELPRVVRNIIRLRSNRGLEMLPIYIGNIDADAIEVEEPKQLTDPLSKDDKEEIEGWIEEMGPTTNVSNGSSDNDETPTFDDDPEDW